MVTPLPQFDEPERRSDSGVPNKLVADLQTLLPQFLLPLHVLISTGWMRNYKWIGIFLLALCPLAVLAFIPANASMQLVFIGLYLSMLWIFFFHQFLNPGEGTWKMALICFFTTGVIVTIAFSLGLQRLRDSFLYSPNVFFQLFGELFTVAILGYVFSLAVILFLLRPGAAIPSVPDMVYYGLVSGLTVGMAEALNWEIANVGAASNAVMYFYEMAFVRLITFPFMQAIWTGLATYFFTLARLYPARRLGLWMAAVCLPLVLETIHCALPPGLAWLDLVMDFLAIFAFLGYVSHRSDFETALQANA